MEGIRQPILSILLLVALACSGCMRLYGIREARKLSEAEITSLSKKVGIDDPAIMHQDFRTTISTILPNGTSLRKDVQQPLQFWLTANDALICNTVNCYTGGFPNLNWNLEKVYTKRAVHTSVPDTLNTVKIIRNALEISNQQSDTIAIIAYSFFMGRQNKRFLKEVREFLSQHPTIDAVYVNMDNSFTDN